MAEKPYVSIFKRQELSEKKKIAKKSQKTLIIEKLQKAQKLANRLKEDDEVDQEVIEKTVEKINDVITDVIDAVGANNEVVSTLIDTVDKVDTVADVVEAGGSISDEEIAPEYPSLDGIEDEVEVMDETPVEAPVEDSGVEEYTFEYDDEKPEEEVE